MRIAERYPELASTAHGLPRDDRRLTEVFKTFLWGTKTNRHLYIQVPAYYDYEVTEFEGQESLRSYFPWREVMADLLEYYRTKSTDFKHPLTQKVVSGEIDINNV